MKNNHLGTMRFDYSDGSIANSWFPYQNLSQEDIEEIQAKVNEIMFERYANFDSVINKCGGTSYDNTCLFEEIDGRFTYKIKLIPVKGDYNGYIYVYRNI